MPRSLNFAPAAIAGALLVVSAPAGLAAGSPASPPVIQSLLGCRKVADSAERLACFDKAAASLEGATANGDLVSLDREQRRAARRQAFGFTLPSLAFLDRGEKAGEADRLTATVAEASQDPYGKWILRLDDGAIWIQTESIDLARSPSKGSPVVITKGAFGGFFLEVNGEPAGKARRQS